MNQSCDVMQEVERRQILAELKIKDAGTTSQKYCNTVVLLYRNSTYCNTFEIVRFPMIDEIITS